MQTIFKVFSEFVAVLFLFYVLVFGHQACRILAPRPGIKPGPPTLEGQVLYSTQRSQTLEHKAQVWNILVAPEQGVESRSSSPWG